MNRLDPLSKRFSHLRIGNMPLHRSVVALGGGGARGIAHLGVLQALGEAGVQTERIVGVSMGGLIGAIVATAPDIHSAQAQTIEFLRSPPFQKEIELLNDAKPVEQEADTGGMFSWYRKMQQGYMAHRRFMRAITHAALASDLPLKNAIDSLLPDCDLQDLDTPLTLVALDLLSGDRVVLERGPLRKAVRASSAIGGIFEPVPWDKMLLCDIGSIEAVPSLVARSYGSDCVIGVDVAAGKTRIEKCETVLDIMMRMEEISERMMRRASVNQADIYIRPNVGNVEWFDFSEPERLIDIGLSAGRKAMEQVKDRSAA